MDKEFITGEIKRTAAANGGKPLGYGRFRNETGIKEYEWGKFWRSWGDALLEAGFAPNKLQTAYDKSELLRLYAAFAQELGRLPAHSDLQIRSHSDPSFPSPNTFYQRLGRKGDLIKMLADFCRLNAGQHEDILQMCDSYAPPRQQPDDEPRSRKEAPCGYVYLFKSGRYYKIGRTNAAGRRERELAIQLPEKAKTIHVISTDDPCGIEAYWHNRFDAKRQNGEWFDLDTSDVAAFKRRKFM
jgi:Meiotically up-regulated gene 113